MDEPTYNFLQKLVSRPGQGDVLEQAGKLLRRQQRRRLYEMIDQIDKEKLEKFVVTLEKYVPQLGRKRAAFMRFSMPNWQGYDELFWQALGDYTILALHRVKDVAYDVTRAKIKVQYFAKLEGDIKSPERVREIIRGIAYLIDTEAVPTDFTHFRRMTERRGTLGAMSKEEAALVGAAITLAFDLAKKI